MSEKLQEMLTEVLGADWVMDEYGSVSIDYAGRMAGQLISENIFEAKEWEQVSLFFQVFRYPSRTLNKTHHV